MFDRQQATIYLQKISPLCEGGYISTHRLQWSDKFKKNLLPGHAHVSLETALDDLAYWVSRGVDTYFCMGASSECKPQKMGPYPTAERKSDKMIASKALYMDLDVKDDGYKTTDELKDALKQFITVFLPPTMIVSSGTGGMHLYWTFDRLIAKEEFLFLADALVNCALKAGVKFDTQCTRDCVRVLRPPGTSNFKHGQPLAVTLAYYSKNDYSYEDIYGKLLPYCTNNSDSVATDGDDNLAGGMQKPQFILSNIDNVAEVCPFVKASLAAGGANHNKEILWTYTIMLSSYCEEASAVAIRFSNGHPSYRESDVLDKLKYHLDERKSSSTAGPPKCATFMREGVEECKTCQFKDMGRSPLNLPGAIKQGWGNTALTVKKMKIPGLPEGYYIGEDNHIYKNISKKGKDGKAESETIEIFEYPIVSRPFGWIGQQDGKFYLYFDTMEGEDRITVSISFFAAADDKEFKKEFANQGLVFPYYKKETREFFMSFQQMLRDQIGGVIRTEPVGWEMKNGSFYGFAYDGKLFYKGGIQNAPKLKNNMYTPMGTSDAWHKLSTIISDQQRSPLDAMLACSFAAPLVPMTGHNGIIVGAYSPKSGIGKTTAIETATAVWGHPVKTRNELNDTVNSTVRRITETRNLPLIWDEIKEPKQFTAVSDLIFQLTGGREKGRLNRSSEVKDFKDFQTMMIYAANASIVEHIISHTKGTRAGLIRVFEFQVPPVKFDKYAMITVQNLQNQLKTNYGLIGLQYAKYLGEYGDEIHKRIVATQSTLEKKFQVTSDERFWVAAMTSLLVATTITNKQGWTNANLPGLYDFLVAEFTRMRTSKNESALDYSEPAAVINLLSEYLSITRAKNTLRINNIRTSPGRPAKGSTQVLLDPTREKMLEEVKIVIGDKPKAIRFPDRIWAKFCKDQNVPVASTRHGLTGIGAKLGNAILSAGTKHAGGIELCWYLLIEGTVLENSFEL